jgi:acetyl esterase/lipase
MKLSALFLAAAVAVLLAVCASGIAQEKAKAEPQPPEGVLYDKDVEFGTGGETKLKLDIARPSSAGKALPCIVVIHGGGWRGGNFKLHVPQIFDFAKHGYVSATVQYRLVPTARWPAQIEDVKCAVRYLRANADKYGIDSSRFGAIGFSAGAHLSMLLGTMDKQDGLEGTGGNSGPSSKVQAVVSYFGPTDLAQTDFPEVVNGMLYDFLGGQRQERADAFKAASPVNYIDKEDAPILHFQGTKDRLVPFAQAYLLSDAMTKAGLPGRVELLQGADHGWGGVELARTIAASKTFFDEHLKKQLAQ